MSRKFTADFETTTDIEDCRVWAFALCEIGNVSNFIYGNNIEDFIKFCSGKDNYILYFHNLKFDAEFIIYYLLSNGYSCIKDKKDKKDKTFTILISDMGQFYSMEIYFSIKDKKHVNKVTIYDSLKILNFSVEKIAKDFNLPIQKLEIDYKAKREINHILTNEEINYIRNDVEIMARALEIMFDVNLTKMTIGSCALNEYKKLNKYFKRYFPILPYEIDKDIRSSYKGGFTYLNDVYKEKIVANGLVLDVNSLYPSVMMNEKLPYGNPIFYEGKYQDDSLYDLYIQKISCSFEIKENKIPSIQLKNNLSFMPNEYIKTTNNQIVTLTLTSVDLKLFLSQYNTENLIYHNGWKFKSMKGLFSSYIDYWSKQKIEAKKNKNGAMYTISKLMLNSLYGKFGLNPNIRSKYPIIDNGHVAYRFYDKEIRDSIYVPIASFITSYARFKTISSSQMIRDFSLNKFGKDLYLYSDTDSIHTLITDENLLKSILDIDDYKLGAWKIESSFSKALFLRQKCYIEQNEDKINVTIAGFPKNLSHLINFENFKVGFTTENLDTDKKKLTYKHVKGGVVLVDTDFTIK